MKKLFLIATLTLSLFASTYSVDQKASTIQFKAKKFLFVGVSGNFSNFSGTITVDENSQLSKIDGLVSIDSINTEDQERDDHLKADDYFYMTKFPNIKFNSNEIVEETVKATVSIKGIEKELSFKIDNLSISDDSISFSLVSMVDRQQFMLNGSMSGVMADNVKVTANIIALKE